jgi:O-antigen ligase
MLKLSKNFHKNKGVPLLFALGVFGFPLFATIPVYFSIESRPISAAFRIIILLLSFFTLLPFKKSTFKNRYFLLFFIFWFFYSIRIIFTSVSEDQIVPFMSNFEFYGFAFGACAIPSLALFNSLQSKNWDAESIFNVAFYILLISTLASIYLSFKIGFKEDVISGRLSTNVLNPITLGHTGVSLILLSIYPLLSHDRATLLKKTIFFIGIVVGILAVLSAASKGPMLALVAALFIFLLLKVKLAKVMSISFVSLIFIFFSIQALGFLQENFGFSAFNRFEGLFNLLAGREADLSTSIRIGLYRDSWNQFLNSPLIGSGIVELNSGFYPHNLFIESFMNTGLIGGIVFILISWFLVQKSIYIIRNQYPLGWVGLLGIQYFIGIIFSGSLFGSYTFWLTMAFVFSIYTYYSKHGVVRH